VAVASIVTGKYRELSSVDGKTFLWIILAGFLGGIVGLFLYFVALKQDLTTKIAPITATFPLFTAIYAYIFLHEPITLLRLIGIVLIVLGLMFINWNSISGPLE